MLRVVLFLGLMLSACEAIAQATFKSGWNTYVTGTITREYTYTYTPADSIRLYLTDSTVSYTSTDSLVTMSLSYPNHDNSVYKTSTYLNNKKQVIKTEEYRDDNLQVMNEWRYDDKNRKVAHVVDNKVTGNNYKKLFDYNRDKKTNELVVSETAYYNGRIEFYTREYYDKNNVKIKEVRLNDNNKDVVHIETYAYGENGKVKERTVYFPEWKVTKKFPEKGGNEIPKCFKKMPVGTAEKVQLATRIAYIKKLIARNQALLGDKECTDFEYRFTNFSNCEIIITPTNVNGGRRVTFRYKEKP